MKIAFLNKYQDKVNRGAETFVSELAKRLSINHNVDIYSDVNYLLILKNKYDVLIPTNGRFQAFMVRIITWLSDSKMVISGQSGAGLDDRINLYSFPDTFIGLSEHQTSWASKINPFVKVVKIPNGVDLSKFNPVKQKSDNGTKEILSASAFTKEKRHDLTIHAVSKLKNVNFKIVGNGGDQKQEIIGLGKKLLGDRFKTTSVSHVEMPNYYKSANVLAFPTVPWESFGIVLVEAMASGLPVVATNDPIRREIIGDAGILVDPTNIDEYSKALDKALNINWGDKPRKQAEKFSWDNIAIQYEDLLKSLVK